MNDWVYDLERSNDKVVAVNHDLTDACKGLSTSVDALDKKVERLTDEIEQLRDAITDLAVAVQNMVDCNIKEV